MWNELPRRHTLDKRLVAKLCNSKESGVSSCHAEQSKNEPSQTETSWLLCNNKQLLAALPSNTSVNTVSRNSEASCVFRLPD
jgi:hypothetical protein